MSNYSFCPKCSSKLTVKTLDRDRLVCTGCRYIMYMNSKPCVAVLVENSGRLMLVRRCVDPFKGDWDLPGGFLEEGEHPEEGACREMREETGLEIGITGLVDILMDTYRDPCHNDLVHTLNLHYTAEPLGGELRPDDDIDRIAWFLPDEIPENLAFHNCREAVSRWKRRKEHEKVLTTAQVEIG